MQQPLPASPPHPPVQRLDLAALRQWPLPLPASDTDKEGRGRLLLVAGSREIPGAVILAANAALRAGIGKLVIATCASVAPGIALAVPEARVIALPFDAEGHLAPQALQVLFDLAPRTQAVLVGPGMQNELAVGRIALDLLRAFATANVVLDAAAMAVVREQGHRFERPVLLTPHAGEMAHLCGDSKEAVQQDCAQLALDHARRWNAVVALKGPATHIATPDGRVWLHEGGNVGLAISGSGDTLSGLIAGLAARGAPLEQAAAWGVALHARAGDQLAERWGLLGYLAREIAAEVPGLMRELSEG